MRSRQSNLGGRCGGNVGGWSVDPLAVLCCVYEKLLARSAQATKITLAPVAGPFSPTRSLHTVMPVSSQNGWMVWTEF